MGEAFERYVEPARRGAPGWWRPLVGLLALILGWILGALLALIPVTAMGLPPQGQSATLFLALIGLIALIPTLWLTLRWIHRRSLGGVLGPTRTLRLRGLAEGAGLMLALAALGMVIAMAFNWIETAPSERAPVPLWLMAVAALMIPAQAAAEELVFRGYLVQELAARTRFALVWLAPPTLIFALLHLTPDASARENLRFMGHIALFALFASGLVWITGGLSHAIGAHAANNLVALLIYESEFGVQGFGDIAIKTLPGGEAPLLLIDLVTSLAGLLIAARFLSREPAPREG